MKTLCFVSSNKFDLIFFLVMTVISRYLISDNSSASPGDVDFAIEFCHTSVLLNTKVNEIKEEVCNGAEVNICCHFHIKFKYDEQLTLKGKNAYTYHLAAFNGVRTFAGFRDGGIEACAVLACLNASITSCGIRFPKYRDVQWPITFEQINVSAEFSQSDERIQYPNSVLASLRSISPQYTSWIRQEVPNGVRRDHILNKPYNKVLTFGIFGRDFSRDSPYPSLSETLNQATLQQYYQQFVPC